MSEQEQTPFFKVPVVPLCVDADLLALPPDTWVHIRNVSCADMGSGSCKAADAIAEIQRTMARQAKGNFTMTEVADVLAAANSFDAYRFLTIEMRPAARSGALTLTNPEFGGPLVGRDSMEFYDWVTPANLDAWLERAGFPFRWPLKPEPQAATPAPVVAEGASNGPLPLTTGDIAFCFDGIRWNEQQWRKPLGDKPKWLQSCVAIPGQRGVSETRWNPVLMAAALVRDGHAQARSIRARFQTKPQLKDWLEAWKTYEADNFDAQ